MKKIAFMSAAFAAAILSLASCQQETQEYIVDVQAHRGGMGLRPANTIEAMKHAIDLGVNTLEMDLVVSKDGKVVLSHDKWFSSGDATYPDGTPVKDEDERVYLWHLNYDEIAKYDVGKRPNPGLPELVNMPAAKPLLTDVIAFTESYAKEKGLPPMKYNIEIKCDPDYKGGIEGEDWPYFDDFVNICVPVLQSLNLGDRLIVQCFDDRALSYMHIKYPDLTLSYLVGGGEIEWLENDEVDFDRVIGKLGFYPEWFSPANIFVSKTTVDEAHRRGMKVVTWTSDDKEDMQRLIDCGVDAIITNYPDRLLEVVRNQK